MTVGIFVSACNIEQISSFSNILDKYFKNSILWIIKGKQKTKAKTNEQTTNEIFLSFLKSVVNAEFPVYRPLWDAI